MLTYPNMKHLWISILPRTIHKYHTPNIYKKKKHRKPTNQPISEIPLVSTSSSRVTLDARQEGTLEPRMR